MARDIVEARGVVLESAGSPTGFVLQIITPGIGSSGYYSADVLESAVKENVFPKGTHLYIDHPSHSEAEDRPERSIRDLAGATTGDAVWNPITQAVEAACKVYPASAWIKDVAEDIGMSIRASADVSEGTIEGRKMPIIEKLIEAYSVDFVTKAGRGGKVLAAIESARYADKGGALPNGTKLVLNDTGGDISITGNQSATGKPAGVADLAAVTAGGQSESEETPLPAVQESAEVSEATRLLNEAVTRAETAEAERDALKTQILERDNRDDAIRRVTERLSTRFDHWPAMKSRVIESVTATLPIKDGVLDVAALDAATDVKATAEADYIKGFLSSGTVSGHGQTEPVPTVDDYKTAEEARARVPFTRPTVRN